MSGTNWYIAIVRGNNELAVMQKLQTAGYEAYTPVQTIMTQTSTGRRKRTKVLLPGICFIRCTEKERMASLRLQLFERFMINHAATPDSFGRHPAAIVPRDQMDRLKYMIGNCDDEITIRPIQIKVGDRVVIRRGALRGLEGYVTSGSDGHDCINILLDFIGCASTRINLTDIAPA